MRILLAVLAFVLFGGISHAEDRYRLFADNRGWTINYDSQDNVCIAVPKSGDGGLFFIRPGTDTVIVMIGSATLAWVKHDAEYPVVIHTDRTRWTGTMKAHSDAGTGGLYLTNPNASFMSALRGAGRMTLRVENVNYGPYSLSGSNDTIKQLLTCAQALERGEFKPAEPEALEANVMREWSADDFGKAFRSGDWTMELNGQDNVDGTATAYLKVSDGKHGETTIKLEAMPEGRGFGGIGVYDLDWSSPSVVFTSFSGGAHCCVAAQVASVAGDQVKQVEVGNFDGAQLEPVDLDNDGLYEFETGDQRFLYAFDSYAGSVPPVRIMGLRDGEVQDLTRNQGFRPVIERHLAKYMQMCFDEPAAGVCAGALGDAALLANYGSALDLVGLEQIDDAMEKSYLGCDVVDACKGRETFDDFEEALTARMESWGYETFSHLSDTGVSFIEKLASVPNGYGAKDAEANSEAGCDLAPLTFEFDKDRRLARMTGYEYSCTSENATALKNSMAVELFCSGEGSFWTVSYVYEVDGENLIGMPLDPHDFHEEKLERLKQCPAKN